MELPRGLLGFARQIRKHKACERHWLYIFWMRLYAPETLDKYLGFENYRKHRRKK